MTRATGDPETQPHYLLSDKNLALNSKFENPRLKIKQKYKTHLRLCFIFLTNKWTDRWTGRMSLIELTFLN
jgi:hypothetical protein